MALIETSSYTNKINSSDQELREQQREETVDFIPALHVKEIYKSFDYKNNKNKGSSKIANYDRISRKQQQLLTNSTSSLRTFTHDVLNGVDLRIREGEFVTIVGPSGCGKSTLLNIIAGLDRPDSGSLLVRGAAEDSNKTSSTHRIMIFQESALFPWLNVQENVEFGLKIAKVHKDRRQQVAGKYIEMVGLSKFSESLVYQLSGGMKQRVAIARALAMEPEVLLMDEPFAALDVQTRDLLYDELVGIHKTTGKTILFVTHNINEAVLLGDRVIILSLVLKNIKKEFLIDLPRPRDPESPELYEIKKQILKEFEGDLQIAKRK
ncbi:MAG TPA: ABC transporter ATP-binding protein [Nitrososphaera sp.]|nr:ABC transporter ATP-binding protein [Nitrososphaera sp.]